MPVEFLCPGCRATLSVARRKIGSGTDCPRCSARIVVPDEFSARTEVVMARLEKSARRERGSSRRADLTVHAEDAQEQTNARENWSAPTPPAAQGAWRVIDDPTDDAPPVVIAEPPPVALWRTDAETDFIVPQHPYASRAPSRGRGVIAQIGLAVAVAAGAFVAGYALGRSHANSAAESAPASANEPVLLEGRISYDDAMGAARGDGQAIVIALPMTPPEIKLQLLGMQSNTLRTADANSEEFNRVGGAMARADENGTFTFVAPRPGEYRFLWISCQANRGDGAMPAPEDLATLQRYFNSPIDLIGLKKYALTTRTIEASTSRLEHIFK